MLLLDPTTLVAVSMAAVAAVAAVAADTVALAVPRHHHLMEIAAPVTVLAVAP